MLTATALLGVVPLIGSGGAARADGPVGSAYERHAHRGGGGPYWHRHRHRAARLVAATNGPAGPILPGQTYSWPFAVTNKGSLSAKNVTFAAPLPKSMQFVSGQPNCSWQGTMAVCQLGALKRGQTKTGMLTAKIAPKAPAGRPISATGRLSWAHSPKAKRVVVSFPKTKVAELTDVAVTTTGPALVRPGAPISYRVTVTNRGAVPAKVVVLRDSAAIATHGAGACMAQARTGPGRTESGRPEYGRKESGRPEHGRKEWKKEKEKATGGAAGAAAAASRVCGRHIGPRVAAPTVKIVGGSAACRPAPAGPTAGGAAGGGLVCALGTMAPGTSASMVFKVRPKVRPGAVIKAPARVTTATIDTVAANNTAVATTRVAAPVLARARVPGRPLVAVPRRVPGKGMTELPATGVPAKPLAAAAFGLIGLGLILYRLGRSRRRPAGADAIRPPA